MKVFYLYILFIFLLFFSCNKSGKSEDFQTFKTLDFSYDDVFNTCFSIKFSQSDTIIIRQHFTSSVSSDTLINNQNYYALLTAKDREKLDSFIVNIDFYRLDTSYFENYEDGQTYQFYIEKDALQKTIYVHSHSIATNVKEFANWIVSFKKGLKLYSSDKTSEFGSLRHFLPPEVTFSQKKFLPPKEE
jgi:hypothetical protein